MADGQQKPPRVSAITLFFMIMISIVLDGVQFLLTLTVVGALFAWLVTALAMCIFGVWFLLLGINYFSGRKAGLKMASMFSSVVIELVPILSALPGITIGVLGVVAASRLEDREDKTSPTPQKK